MHSDTRTRIKNKVINVTIADSNCHILINKSDTIICRTESVEEEKTGSKKNFFGFLQKKYLKNFSYCLICLKGF